MSNFTQETSAISATKFKPRGNFKYAHLTESTSDLDVRDMSNYESSRCSIPSINSKILPFMKPKFISSLKNSPKYVAEKHAI